MRLVVEAEHHIHLEQRFDHSRRTEAEKVVGLVAILVGVAASDVVEVPAALAAAAAEEQARGLLDLHDQP
jgi:predicted benzoate:H+ symporter BenE